MRGSRGGYPASAIPKAVTTTDIRKQIAVARQKTQAKRLGQRHVTKEVAAERERVLAAWLAARDEG